MKRMLALVAVCSLACAQTFANDLTDPGMNSIGPNGQLGNTPNPPWVLVSSRGGNPFNDGAASEAFADHDGGGFGIFFKAFIGNPPWDPTAGPVDVHIAQAVPGTPGRLYTLSGWWGAEDNYSGLHTPGANAIFAIDFLDGSNALIGSAELDLEAAGLGDPAVPGLNYELFSLSATSPAGTASVRARGSMLGGVFFQDPGQALVTDEWSLTSVPEPTTALVGGAMLVGMVARRRTH